PCYAEGATNGHGGPNPGADSPRGPPSINPGQDCTDPGPYYGDYSPGNPFPVYVSATWCPDQQEWRLTFDVYYVHDGNLSAGHPHDWEGIIVVFRKDPGARGEDWWVASGVIFNRHHWHDYYDWADVNTVSGLDDVRADVLGSGKNHPKVYVGLYSHSAYRSKCDIGCGNLVNTGPLVWNEYRSSDWFRL
ncbi:hypothetical protein BU26DRAFT_410465, partial [Trematosphaeria pertusa]